MSELKTVALEKNRMMLMLEYKALPQGNQDTLIAKELTMTMENWSACSTPAQRIMRHPISSPCPQRNHTQTCPACMSW